MVSLVVLTVSLAHALYAVPAPTPLRQSPPPEVSQEQPWPPPGVSRPGTGTTTPRLLKDRKPFYTAAAMDAQIQGVVRMELVVEVDGSVGQVRVMHSLDKVHGLDEEAVRTVKQWRFRPGTRDGVAVPVVVEVEMSFSLRKPGEPIVR